MQNRIQKIIEAVSGKYFGNEGAGALFYSRSNKTILWAKRATKGMKEPNTWTAVFGGRVEKGESPKTAVIREIGEELKFNKKFTITPSPVFIYKDDVEKFKYSTFQITVDHEFEPVLNWEHSKFMWLPLGQYPKEKIHFGTTALIRANII